MPALSTVRLPSATLDRVVNYTALLPETRPIGHRGPFPVLYLLHPHGGDHDDWIVKTRLADYVRNLPLLVILPPLDNSFGCNTAMGEEYEKFFLDELMAHVESTFAVRTGPSQTAIAGAGEGGYAALRYALSYPYWFGAAGSLSGIVYANNEARMQEIPNSDRQLHRLQHVFGQAEDTRRKAWDLTHLAQYLPHETLPELMLACGKEDPFLNHNRDFHKKLQAMQFRATYEETSGTHDWAFWDSRLPDLLSFVMRTMELDK